LYVKALLISLLYVELQKKFVVLLKKMLKYDIFHLSKTLPVLGRGMVT